MHAHAPRATLARWPALALAGLLFAGCGGADAPEAEGEMDALPGRMGAIDAANRAAAAASGRSPSAPSADAMRERMPARAAGMARSELRVESSWGGTPGVTTVRATYGGGARRIEIAMADLGSVPGLAASVVPWLGANVDRRTGGGFERTARIEGLQGFEAQRTEGGAERSEVSVMAGGVLVRLEGWGVSVAELREALRQLDPGPLAR